MSKDLECIYCNTRFSVDRYANFKVICPCCNRSIYLECEYGYGPVTPCQIYWGKEIVGIVTFDKTIYNLRMDHEKIPLNNTYLKAIPEAEEIIRKSLNISCHNESMPILTKGGSLCVYGDWIGRPYDYHKIIDTNYDGEILEMKFDRQERLLVYNPENVISTKQELKIENAKKTKWIYIPYESATTKYNTMVYTVEGDLLTKETKHGIEHLKIKAPFTAVYLG